MYSPSMVFEEVDERRGAATMHVQWCVIVDCILIVTLLTNTVTYNIIATRNQHMRAIPNVTVTRKWLLLYSVVFAS